MDTADLLSGLNNFDEYDIYGSEFSKFFGFTEEEINNLLNECLVVNNEEDKMQSDFIKMCYYGYKIGEYKIYNPWSIMKCLNKAQQNPLQGCFQILESF